MNKILVTGGNGLIGSRIASELSKENKVMILDLTENRNFDSLVFDVTDNSWIDSVGKFDYVFHFAYIGGGIYSSRNPIKLIHTELTGLYNVLNYALEYNTKKVIYPSSAILSDKFKQNFSFSKVHSNAFFSYPAAKQMGEYFIEEFHKENEIGYSIIRYYNVYGEGQNKEMVVPFFVRDAIEGRPIVLFGSGKQQRDFTYAGDAAKATILAAFSEKTFSKAVEVGTGKNTSVLDLAKLIKKLTHSKSELIRDKFPSGLDELETERIAFNSAELKKLTGFTCNTSLEEGLKKVIYSIQKK
ncbi:NAD-dependent epimerase/dehydratase family protein [Candidatus Micrarchaeota archaeon]|nr:NAD-dependent epimerase/dehydratase family protein [Candidatus Micrarchaeota archaeon]